MLNFDQLSQIVTATNTMPGVFVSHLGRLASKDSILRLLARYKKESFGDGLEPEEYSRLKAAIDAMDSIPGQSRSNKPDYFVPVYNVYYILSGYTCMEPAENEHFISFMNSEMRKIEEASKPPRPEPTVLKKPSFWQRLRWVLNW